MEQSITMDKNRMAMLLFIGSEAVFFSLLILAYVYFRSVPANGPTAASSLDPLTTGIFSLFLFGSSFTIWRAEKSLHKGNEAGLKGWLLATIVLGLIFLGGQGFEWRHLIGEGTTVSRNLFGTTFFTLTGFHGLHVLIGLIALSVLFGSALAGDYRAARSSRAVETISLYWHFVDIVWVVVFSVIYLWIVIAP